MNDLITFRDTHKDCEILMGRTQNNKYTFTCSNHGVCLIVMNTDIMPSMCRYPSLDCAIRGYCNREIACND